MNFFLNWLCEGEPATHGNAGNGFRGVGRYLLYFFFFICINRIFSDHCKTCNTCMYNLGGAKEVNLNLMALHITRWAGTR